jgi:hypothetical protein
LRRHVAAGAATYNNQNKTKQTKENKQSRKWQTPFVHTNGTAAARTLPTTQKRKEKKKKNWRMNGLKTINPFSSLAPFL